MKIEELNTNHTGNHLLSVRKLCKVLFTHVANLSYSQFYFAIMTNISVIIMISLPFIVRDPSTNAWAVVYYISSGISIFLFLNINFNFFFCPIFDAQRREIMAKAMSHMISVSSITLENNELMKATPKFNLRNPQNVYAWMYTRLIMQSYGKRMLFRFDTYIGVYLLMALGLTIALIYKLYTVDSITLFSRPIFVQAIYFVFILLSMMATIIYLFSRVNDEYEEHLQVVALNELKLESELSFLFENKEEMLSAGDFGDDKVKYIEKEIWRRDESIKALSRVAEVLRISNELNPLKVKFYMKLF